LIQPRRRKATPPGGGPRARLRRSSPPSRRYAGRRAQPPGRAGALTLSDDAIQPRKPVSPAHRLRNAVAKVAHAHSAAGPFFRHNGRPNYG
jgi:hypothetical protein